MSKKMIWVCSPPASGKTYVSKKISERLRHVVYLDKDSLVPLSNVAFNVAHEPNDREGPFFEKYLRDVEYDVIIQMGLDALTYDDIVLINAPFGKEIRNKAYIDGMRKRLNEEKGARLVVIWVKTSIEVVHQRMIERNSPRDEYKLKDWDAFVKQENFEIPQALDDPEVKDDLLIFDNDDEKQFENSMIRIVKILED